MPRFKGSCGCYNRDDARQFGVVPAIVWNDMLDRSEHLNSNPMWYDQCDAADRLGIPRQTINRAVKTLEEVGRVETKLGYRPNTSVTTTWVTINAEESQLRDNLDAQNEHPKDAQNEHPILKDTNNHTEGGIIDFGMMKAIVQKFVRDHQSQSNPITFTPSKLKEYYPSLKEWAIDNGVVIDRAKVITILENALDEAQNEGWMDGKDLAIAFKDTCVGRRLKKQQKKGGLNDNEW